MNNDTTAYTTALNHLVTLAGSIGAAVETVHTDLDGGVMDAELAAAMVTIRATACITDNGPYYSDSIADDVISDLLAMDLPLILARVDELSAPGATWDDDDVTDLLDRLLDVTETLTESDAARIIATLTDAADPALTDVADRVRELLRDNTDLVLDLFNN